MNQIRLHSQWAPGILLCLLWLQTLSQLQAPAPTPHTQHQEPHIHSIKSPIYTASGAFWGTNSNLSPYKTSIFCVSHLQVSYIPFQVFVLFSFAHKNNFPDYTDYDYTTSTHTALLLLCLTTLFKLKLTVSVLNLNSNHTVDFPRLLGSPLTCLPTHSDPWQFSSASCTLLTDSLPCTVARTAKLSCFEF